MLFRRIHDGKVAINLKLQFWIHVLFLEGKPFFAFKLFSRREDLFGSIIDINKYHAFFSEFHGGRKTLPNNLVYQNNHIRPIDAFLRQWDCRLNSDSGKIGLISSSLQISCQISTPVSSV